MPTKPATLAAQQRTTAVPNNAVPTASPPGKLSARGATIAPVKREAVQAEVNAIPAAINAAHVIPAPAQKTISLSVVVKLRPIRFAVIPIKQVRTSAGTATTSAITPSPGNATNAPRQTAANVVTSNSVSMENWMGLGST
jgi:hypothetical protein